MLSHGKMKCLLDKAFRVVYPIKNEVFLVRTKGE